MTPSTITNKHSSSTKALHVAQSTSFSSRTTLPIKTRKKNDNTVFSDTNVDYSLVFISFWHSVVELGMAQHCTDVCLYRHLPKAPSNTVSFFSFTSVPQSEEHIREVHWAGWTGFLWFVTFASGSVPYEPERHRAARFDAAVNLPWIHFHWSGLWFQHKGLRCILWL